MAGGKGGGDYSIIIWSKTIILVVFLQREVHFYSLTNHGIQKKFIHVHVCVKKY